MIGTINIITVSFGHVIGHIFVVLQRGPWLTKIDFIYIFPKCSIFLFGTITALQTYENYDILKSMVRYIMYNIVSTLQKRMKTYIVEILLILAR